MNKLDMLVKCITLIYRESLIENEKGNSSDLIKKCMGEIKPANAYSLQGGDIEILNDLKTYILGLVNKKDILLDLDSIIQTLQIILKDKKDILRIVVENLTKELGVDETKKRILFIRGQLNEHIKKNEFENMLYKTYSENKNNNSGLLNTDEIIVELIQKLEQLGNTMSNADPAVVGSMDISDEKNIQEIADNMKSNASEEGGFVTGWQALNRMIDMIIRGEFVTIGALQHNYKSGFTVSLFIFFCMLNKPFNVEKGKKPAIVFYSKEDNIELVLNFIYKFLHYYKHKELPDIKNVSKEEISKTVKDALTRNGFHPLLYRINPSEWTYKHMFNHITGLEADGYEIFATFSDYLGMLPTIGCDNSGPSGTALRDLFRRTRNFMSTKRIAFITPHQLSPDAKKLIRTGTPDILFVKEVANKGYYSGSSQLDQEIDLELFIHKCYMKRKPYLAIQRGKHRGDHIKDEKDMYFLLPFPHKAPIMPDLDGEDSSTRGLEDDDGDVGLNDIL